MEVKMHILFSLDTDIFVFYSSSAESEPEVFQVRWDKFSGQKKDKGETQSSISFPKQSHSIPLECCHIPR